MALIIGEKETRKLIDMPRALNVMASWQADSDLLCLRAYVGEANTVTLYNGRTGKIQNEDR